MNHLNNSKFSIIFENILFFYQMGSRDQFDKIDTIILKQSSLELYRWIQLDSSTCSTFLYFESTWKLCLNKVCSLDHCSYPRCSWVTLSSCSFNFTLDYYFRKYFVSYSEQLAQPLVLFSIHAFEYRFSLSSYSLNTRSFIFDLV